MKVFKFGGASVKSAEAVKNVGHVLNLYKDEQILVVVSAMGKTTNKLEQIAQAYYNQKTGWLEAFNELKSFHQEIITGLLSNQSSHTYDDIDNLFVELECLLETKPESDFSYIYDQIISFGEILSTKIISSYLNEAGFKNRWMDARNFIITDNRHREGQVNWDRTTTIIGNKLGPILKKQIIITQGFIGRSTDLHTTTLGREGSDYSAAIFAYGLDAESVTIWKDVDGVMNADPKRFADAVKLDQLSYTEAIELAYYGATVIHPKTIQPLQSKGIPLFVKSFLTPEGAGTIVSNDTKRLKPVPNFIFKPDQALISISSKDFSFITEDHLKALFSCFAEHRIRINVMQNSAISFSVCIDHDEQKQVALQEALTSEYAIEVQDAVELITIYNYTREAIDTVLESRKLLMEQKTHDTIQFVVA